jgi:hypothetical protein
VVGQVVQVGLTIAPVVNSSENVVSQIFTLTLCELLLVGILYFKSSLFFPYMVPYGLVANPPINFQDPVKEIQ